MTLLSAPLRLVAFALAALAILLGLGSTSNAQTPPPLQPAVLDLTLNTEPHGEIRVLIGTDNEVWAEMENAWSGRSASPEWRSADARRSHLRPAVVCRAATRRAV